MNSNIRAHSGIEDHSPKMNDYRFENFRLGLALHDMHFSQKALRPGQAFPDFELLTPDGHLIRAKDFVSQRPLLIVTGSLSCPMTASSLPVLRRLYDKYRDDVAFVLLYTREAHPGEYYPQPHTYEQKAEHAQVMRDIHDLPWPVVVDDINGTLHRSLDSKPNTAYLIDMKGDIAFRALWASDESHIREAIQQVIIGERPSLLQSNATMGPLARALGYIPEVLTLAGPQAKRDMIRSVPPMVLMGWFAGRFRSLPKPNRGIAVIASMALAVSGLMVAALALL